MMRMLIDSDVVIAAMSGNEDQSIASQGVMDALAEGRFQGLTTPVLMANIMFVLTNKWRIGRKQVDRPRVVKAMNSLLPLFTMLPVDDADFFAAFSSSFADLEDGIQHFAALRSRQVDGIITCNFKDFATGELPALEPGEFLEHHLS